MDIIRKSLVQYTLPELEAIHTEYLRLCNLHRGQSQCAPAEAIAYLHSHNFSLSQLMSEFSRRARRAAGR